MANTRRCQSNLEIDAGSKIDAAELLKKTFCQDEGISKWSLHADRIQIREADFPSSSSISSLSKGSFSDGSGFDPCQFRLIDDDVQSGRDKFSVFDLKGRREAGTRHR